MKIDLRQVYHQIRIKEGDKQKGVFRIKESLFKLIVLQFRFINVPVIFQRRINYMLGEYLNNFIIAYFNIIIYLNSKEEYKEYIKQVLGRLYNKNMPIIVEKYKFYIKKTNFIKFIIKLKQIHIDLKKI